MPAALHDCKPRQESHAEDRLVAADRQGNELIFERLCGEMLRLALAFFHSAEAFGVEAQERSSSLEEVEDVHKVILLRIAKQQKEAETGNITFKKSVRLSRECYVLLRLARKIKAEEHKTYRNGTCYEFEVALDKDELKLFKEMCGEKVK